MFVTHANISVQSITQGTILLSGQSLINANEVLMNPEEIPTVLA